MKILINKYIDYILMFFNIIYSCGDTSVRYFLKEINFNKEMIDKSIEKNKRTIRFVVLFAFIDSLLLVDSMLSFKFFFSITFTVFFLGVIYPFLDKFFINKEKR